MLNTELADLLNRGLAALNIALDENRRVHLLDFLALLKKWTAVYNLTAIQDPFQMLIYHLLDSLSLLPLLDPLHASTLLDIGTGAGLPGLVLAIARPRWQVSLNDYVQKKTAFLIQAKAQLQLSNVAVITSHAESLYSNGYPGRRFDIVISRAFAKLTYFVSIARHLVSLQGSIWAMKGSRGRRLDAEIAEMQLAYKDVQPTRIIELHVPFLEASRHAVQMTLKSA